MGDSMTQKIYKDGTDQYVMTRLGGIDPDTGAQSILFGESEGDSLDIENLVIVWSEYKKEGEAITPPVITWDSSAGMWKILIPHGNITQYGSVWLNVSGTAMIPVAIEVETVSTYDYNENTLEGTFSRVEVERMVAAVLLGNETRVPGTSTFVGLDGTTSRVIASLASAGRTITTRDGE